MSIFKISNFFEKVTVIVRAKGFMVFMVKVLEYGFLAVALMY